MKTCKICMYVAPFTLKFPLEIFNFIENLLNILCICLGNGRTQILNIFNFSIPWYLGTYIYYLIWKLQSFIIWSFKEMIEPGLLMSVRCSWISTNLLLKRTMLIIYRTQPYLVTGSHLGQNTNLCVVTKLEKEISLS